MNVAPSQARRRRVIPRLRGPAKSLARGVARVIVLPWYLSYRCRALFLRDRAFVASSHLLSLIPGLLGDYVRREFYRLTLLRCAPDAFIGFGTIFASSR